ncbi:MAG: DUF1549 domain-containing protein [Blastocatellia bacterium]|nr:DUF1549 domain-containing protein [Blastocatellia bacterium]
MKHRAKSAQHFLVVLFVAAAVALFTFEQSSHTQTKIDFNRDIRPILSDKCFACHGPDAAAKKIKLRLDSEPAALTAIAPGKPEESKLIKRITHKDETLRMPPVDSGRTLAPREIELLTEWIRQGANWQSHWSFIPPIRPALPPVKNTAWPKNAIDYFVLARLEKEGGQPSPEADRATLLRRVSLDLTGLPPTVQELDAFLNDKSPNAYEKVVDRLLASPRYGERMAFKWLDAARYADTNGYQIDGERSMWRWRDWVIAAFNANKPFDEFTIEQLAGDLLPNPRKDQIIATAFNRNHRTNSEDGLIPEEYRVEYVVDRVDTTSTVFLGLTMGCARCHNHKYDPLTQKEYYQLFAYFNSIPEDGRANNYGNSAPWISAPTAAQEAEMQKIERDINRIKTRLSQEIKLHAADQSRWEKSLRAESRTQWFPKDNLLFQHALDDGAQPFVSETMMKVAMDKPDEEVVERKDAKKLEQSFKNGTPKFVAAPTGQGVAFDKNLLFDAGKIADFNFRDRLKDYKDQFTISAWFYAESEQSGALVTHMQDSAGETDNNLPKGRGYGLFVANGKLHFNLVSVWADDSFRVETESAIPLKEWQHVIATFDATEPYERVQIFLNGQKQKLKINLPRLFRTFGDANANLRIGAGGGPAFRFAGMIDEVRVYKSLPDANDIAMLSCADSLEKIAATPVAKRTEAQRLKITNAWLDAAAPATAADLLQQLRQQKQRKTALEAEFSTLMVMQEMPEPRPTFLLRRGAYDLPTEKVARALPASLHGTSVQPSNRLEFARWLVSPENPLTARVTVNRFWQQFFGIGLVKTTEDFGAQGELPSHPELLDWLAVEFMRPSSQLAVHSSPEKGRELRTANWDVKALLKTIVTSATYRQASKITPTTDHRPPTTDDSDNRLLARGPRYRLSAEMIRDQALFVSGLLVEKLGGPSVKPYQPEGLWKDMTFSNMTNYGQAKGEGLWRRSLYTFWKRTVLNPSMLVFDATAREFCNVRETRTNSPLQALNLMNDVTYVEAARFIAERMLQGNGSAEQRLTWAFRALTSRLPDAQELQVLRDNLNAQLDYFRAHPDDAAKLLAMGEKRNDAALKPTELAAYTTVASLLLNLDEVITKQ